MELTAALSGMRAAIDLARVAMAARDSAKIDAALTDISTRLTAALMAGLATAEKAHALETQLREAERKNAELEQQIKDRAMYRLQELAAGSFAYASQPSLDGANPPQHYLCQPCYDSSVKTVLRLEPNAWGGEAWVCARDKAHGFAARDRKA